MYAEQEITAKTIADAAEKGDKTALEVYKICGEKLGKGISVLIDILNPEVIVIGSIFVRSNSLIAAIIVSSNRPVGVLVSRFSLLLTR